jgi:alkylation response protein AidB-like acyl-CoA dehydrogenase
MTNETTLRTSIREFIAAHPPPDLRGQARDARITRMRAWAATLYDNGFAGPAWPREFGGMELGFAEQVAYHDEFAKVHAPGHPGNGPFIAGPTLLRYGSDEQKKRYLPAMLRGDEIWAQGFSEPGAGSDLQSLATRARRDGDHYIVSGTKLWSTFADVADMMFALVRTGSPDSGSGGISYLLIEMRSAGVSVRPLRDMSGHARFCQVFLDEVRVPVANRVGEENKGWQLARATLGYERAARSLLHASAYRRRMSGLAALLKERNALDDPLARDALARTEIDVRIMGLNAARIVSAMEKTGTPGPAASITRLHHSLVEQSFYRTAVDLIGQDALVTAGAQAVQGARWLTGYLHSRGATIGAGTAEVQRNTIAEQILNLPRWPQHDEGRSR